MSDELIRAARRLIEARTRWKVTEEDAEILRRTYFAMERDFLKLLHDSNIISKIVHLVIDEVSIRRDPGVSSDDNIPMFDIQRVQVLK